LGIVASGQDGQPTTLADGETALIVRPCEQAALAQAMIRLAQDEALRRRLGQAARLEAEALHSWRHTAVEIETILQQAMRR
jgi:glycosyltransferase involved in cell wall biosynthesis